MQAGRQASRPFFSSCKGLASLCASLCTVAPRTMHALRHRYHRVARAVSHDAPDCRPWPTSQQLLSLTVLRACACFLLLPLSFPRRSGQLSAGSLPVPLPRPKCRKVGRETGDGGEQWRAQSKLLFAFLHIERTRQGTSYHTDMYTMLDKRQYIQPDGKGNGNRVGLPVVTDALEAGPMLTPFFRF